MIILASKSPRRIKFFKHFRLDFKSVPAEINENIDLDISGFIPCRLAEIKAEAVAKKYPGTVTVGVDTVVIHSNMLMGKPKDIDEAERFLLTLSGDWHSVISGVCIVKISECVKYIFSDISKVKFRKLNHKIIKDYFRKVDPLDKAGAYAIQEYGDILVEKIVGSKDNIIGFPTEKFFGIMKFVDPLFSRR
jgi:septum formation protein